MIEAQDWYQLEGELKLDIPLEMSFDFRSGFLANLFPMYGDGLYHELEERAFDVFHHWSYGKVTTL